ncbi:MAG: DNA internalization-related competence protein ComEC/Rec2 [Melioribacteraceae bacterium]|nr:DNA internalization-related competence protein ComEC/Rec2 [Melioribacteraceae bacterium]
MFTSLLIFLMGSINYGFYNFDKLTYPFDKQVIKNALIFGGVTECNLLTKEKVDFTLNVDSVKYDDQLFVGSFIAKVSVRDKSIRRLRTFHGTIEAGNYIEVETTIREPRNERNPGEFDYQKYLLTKNIVAIASCNSVAKVKLINNNVDYFNSFIFGIRKKMAGIIERNHDPLTSGFLKGLLLADRSEIDEKLKEKFINAGVVHVLAVSGLHVGYIVLIFIFLFARFNLKLRIILTIIGLLFFMFLTGAHPSVFRATVMAIVIIISKYSGRQNNNYNSLAIASLIILFLNPNELFNPGFQLSFSAVLAIITLTPIFQKQIYAWKINSKFVKWILLFCAVSFSAQLGTLPFTLIYFNKLSIIALFANIIVIPMIGFIVGVGVFTIFLSFISDWLTSIYALSNDFLVKAVADFTDIMGSSSLSYIYIPQFSIYDIITFYFMLIAAFYFYPKIKNSKTKIIFTILLLINSFVYFSIDDEDLFKEDELTITAIDIGQGDALFIKFPNGKTALVDAGNATEYFDNGSRVILPLLKRNNINKIDYAFISHVDADHYKGIYSIIDAGLVDTVYKPEIDTTLKKDIRFENFLNKKNIPIRYYKKGIKNIGNCRLYILNELDNPHYQNLDVNNKSGIIKLVHGKNSFLFIGDAEAEMEGLLCESYGKFLKCNVLKVSHHGSKTGSTEEFINFTNPEIGIISAGIGNKFGHPAKVVLDRLKKNKIKISRTDLNGAVVISSDGSCIKEIDWRN